MLQQRLMYDVVDFLPPKWPSRAWTSGAWVHDGAASDSEVCKLRNRMSSISEKLDQVERFVHLSEAGRGVAD
jgi:hypothetical protein